MAEWWSTFAIAVLKPPMFHTSIIFVYLQGGGFTLLPSAAPAQYFPFFSPCMFYGVLSVKGQTLLTTMKS